jgi:DNA-binding transcriptional MerR regulator
VGQKINLRSGTLAKAAGVSTDTLRHYERLGVLKKPPRTDGGYRLYPPEAIDRVLLVRDALASGFTLRELTSILRVRDAGGAPCRQVAELAHEKVNKLDAQIEQLTRLRDSLKLTAKDWDRRMKKTPTFERANLLQSLSRGTTRKMANTKGERHERTTVSVRPDNDGSRQQPKRNVFSNPRHASTDNR